MKKVLMLALFLFMVNYPKVKFTISQKKELETFMAFLNESEHLNNRREMNWAFYKPHPKLKILKQNNLSFLTKKSIVKKYIDDYYRENLAGFKKDILIAKKDWQNKEKSFFNLTDIVFKNYPWPKGKYIAYPTIWGMYPRYLEDKTFQFPYYHKKKNFIPVVIAHEMLHFIFYDYLYRFFPKYKESKYNFQVWNISEAFNILIQNSEEWVEVFNQRAVPYPEHKNLIQQMQKIFNKKQDVNYLLRNLLYSTKAEI